MCEAMYSTSKGTARSMNIDDITRILDYAGKQSCYRDVDDIYHYTTEAMKIGDIEKKWEKALVQIEGKHQKVIKN